MPDLSFNWSFLTPMWKIVCSGGKPRSGETKRQIQLSRWEMMDLAKR